MFELSGDFAFATWFVELAEVNSYKLSPVDVGCRLENILVPSIRMRSGWHCCSIGHVKGGDRALVLKCRRCFSFDRDSDKGFSIGVCWKCVSTA